MEHRIKNTQPPRVANAVLNQQQSLLRYLTFQEKKEKEQFSLIRTREGTGRVPQQITGEAEEDGN